MTALPQKPPVWAVVGATASGKTALGVQLALQYNGEVVSADSMQIYKGLDIATAKPTPEEMQGVPHHLISALSPETPCSVADYVKYARAAIAEIHAMGRLPIVVGGTGLYIDSLLENIQFPDVPSSQAVRDRLAAEAEAGGTAALLARLQQCDPESAAKLHENNLRRVIRALEVFELTGTTLSEFARQSRSVPTPWDVTWFGVGFADRQKLYDRIDARVDAMLEMGLADEVREEYESGRRRATAAAAIGYKELLPWLQGEASMAECIAKLKQETRRYAKRQGTWFRRNEQINWIYRDDICDNLGIFLKCQKIIAKRGEL